MVETPNPFEDHAVGVVNGLAACAEGWSELLELGVPEGDLGLVVSDRELRRAGSVVNGDAAESLSLDGRAIIVLAPLDVDGSALLHTSRSYPADLIRKAVNGAGHARWSFDGLFSEREGRALADAILAAGASIWVRTRTLDVAGQAAAVLLRISTERVRTFSRPAALPPSPARLD
jgi:hypothetical protein